MPVVISLLNLLPPKQQSVLTKILIKILDKVLGIHHLDGLYRNNNYMA